MKQFLFTLIACLMSMSLFSQDTQEWYVGTWKWTDKESDSEIIVKLRLFHGDYPSMREKGARWQFTNIVGAYSYKKNGVIVADNLNEVNENYVEYLKYPIVIWHMEDFKIRDPKLRNYDSKSDWPKVIDGSSTIECVSAKPKKIKWKLVDDEGSGGIMVEGYGWHSPKGISLPIEITLKQVSTKY